MAEGHGGDAASLGARARTKSARSSDEGAAAEPPLVHSEHRFDTGKRPTPDGLRRSRFMRRSQSSKWLIADAVDSSTIEELGDGLFVDTESGEVLESDWVRPPRPARCGWRIGENVSVHSDGQFAHFSGTERCGSIHACPICSAVIRAERAREISQAVEAHQAAGGSILFVTLTIRHDRTDPLKQSMDAVLGSWRKLLQGSAWVGSKSTQGAQDRYRVSGYIRSTEVTYGSNGWHPHIHALFFTDDKLSDTEVAAFGDELHTRWARFAHKATGKLPTREHGTDVQRVDEDGQVLGRYLAKLQEAEGKSKTEKWDASAELARADVKRGRGDNFVPFELLDSDHPMPLPQRRRLWVDYYEGTKGRRAITWSRGLKARYEVGEKTDQEVIEETEAAPVQWVADGSSYDALRRSDPELLALALDAAAGENWEVVKALLPGHEPPPGAVDGTGDRLAWELYK
ncbi:protein rep [Brevibacterium linens]|uniref:protein rep n=1 Tax=Brevibacterium linens TaxID=1703 RepID=UPI000FCA58B8|nr:protein rep [Brevibacterium linens]